MRFWQIATICPHCRKDNVENREGRIGEVGDLISCKCNKCGKSYMGMITSKLPIASPKKK